MRFRWWVFIAAAVFALGLLLGFSLVSSLVFAPSLESEQTLLGSAPTDFLSAQMADFGGDFRPLLSFFSFGLFAFIFIKNVIAVGIVFALSPFFGLMPVISLAFNGLLIGVVSATVIQQKSLAFLIAAIAPHGILEIPAFLMAAAAALSFGWSVIRALFSESGRSAPFSGFKSNAVYLRIALLLLLPAAAIEAFVTPFFII